MKKNLVLKIIMVLSIIGLLISIYLVKNHYAGVEKGSFCDFSETVSCSLVNNSIYSEFLNVSVALFGALWFAVLFLLAWRAKKQNDALLTLLLEWNVLGFLSVLYMVYAEITLKAICPACTVLHLIIAGTLVVSYLLYKQEKAPLVSSAEVWKTAKPWIVLAAVIFIIPLIIFNLPEKEKKSYDAIAQCITEKNVVMYSSFRCGVCAKTRAAFGDAFRFIHEIECHPQGENSQWQLCQQKHIPGTPTWIMEPQGIEIQRHTGYLSPEEVAAFAGCNI